MENMYPIKHLYFRSWGPFHLGIMRRVHPQRFHVMRFTLKRRGIKHIMWRTM